MTYPRVPSARSQLVKAKRAAKANQLQDTFAAYWRMLHADLPSPVQEFKFDKVRKWRLDFAWPALRVAVELDGGGYGQQVRCQHCGAVIRARKADGSLGKALRIPAVSHYNEEGHARDCEKSNALVRQNWLALRFTSRMIEADPHSCLEAVAVLVQLRMQQLQESA